MEVTKFFLLLCLVAFGAYAEYQAGKTVQKSEEKRLELNERSVSDSDVNFMRKAIALSRFAIADHGDRFGSVVVRNGRIIGESLNSSVSSHDLSAHAEVKAIRAASLRLKTKDLKGATLYTSAQPCSMCLSLIYSARISKVFYCISGEEITSFDTNLKAEDIVQELSKVPHERTIPEIPILPEEGAKTIERCEKVRGE
jgi:guanine deaminase